MSVLVLNEVDKLSREAQHSLRRTMEKYSAYCRLILCCNSSSKVTEAIRSRCLNVRINAPTDEQVGVAGFWIVYLIVKNIRLSCSFTSTVNLFPTYWIIVNFSGPDCQGIGVHWKERRASTSIWIFCSYSWKIKQELKESYIVSRNLSCSAVECHYSSYSSTFFFFFFFLCTPCRRGRVPDSFSFCVPLTWF